MQQFKEIGYLPQAMVNYLALLGWGDGTENEFFTLEELGWLASIDIPSQMCICLYNRINSC